MTTADCPITVVHDYLTQRGGAERVVLSMLKAFPEAPLYTSLYDPDATFDEFGAVDVRPLPLNRSPLLRRRHRLALPFLASAFDSLESQSVVTVCSTSGWAHGTRARGRKVVYCYTPPRWLYDPRSYVTGVARRTAMGLFRKRLARWDQTAAASADRYLTSSRAMQARIRRAYGIDAEILPPPITLDVEAPLLPVPGLEPGFVLCVSRLLRYKNVGAVVEASQLVPSARFVVAGTGPEAHALRRAAGDNVEFLGAVSDAELRYLYANCAGLVAAGYEDFGLTPLEAAAFGKPTAALRYGGFLDTLVAEQTGIFFDRPVAADIAAAVRRLLRTGWDEDLLRRHAESFSEERFAARLREIVDEEMAYAA